jgi:D-amino-acid dehydrogenase
MGPAPRHPGLYLDFGHSHLGFTLGPVSGRLIAEIILGEKPVADPAPYAVTRFTGI